MLWLATSLRRAAEMLDEAHNGAAEGRNEEDFAAAFYGAPILRAQSAEIALKALWRIGHDVERGNPPRHHNPTKTIQMQLAERFPEVPDPSCPHFPIPYRNGLRAILNDYENALQQWRYAHECNSLGFKDVFDEVLNTLIKVGWELHNQRLRWLREGGAEAPSPAASSRMSTDAGCKTKRRLVKPRWSRSGRPKGVQ